MEKKYRRSYTDMVDFKQKIKDIMKSFRAEKVDSAEVAFLAPKKYSNSMLSEIGVSVNELGDNFDSKSILPKFATIQGFKGLDAKIVILVDVEILKMRIGQDLCILQELEPEYSCMLWVLRIFGNVISERKVGKYDICKH